MNSLLSTLEANEPMINAIVGLLTLGAAIWGCIQLALLPMLGAQAPESTDQNTSDADQRKFRLWSSLVNRGVDSRAELVEQVSARTLNTCLILIVATTLVLVVIALLEDNVAISMTNLLLFLVAIVAYNLHAAGFAKTARWLVIVAVTLYWNLNILMMGTRVGLEYGLAGVLLLPLLLFERDQRPQLYGASLLVLLSLPVAIAAETQLNASWPFNNVTVPPGYYYGNAIVLAFYVFLALYFFNRAADASFHRLEDQQQKSQELIHTLLPAYIAEKVASRDDTLADWHSEASVLFATVVGFENLYERVSAVQLVEILKQVFEQFDELVEAQGVEKINTLGTNYVAATGIDITREASSEQLAMVAIGMREVVEDVSATIDHPFGLRVGISTGDVVSGVIGDARPSFDIWGKTVELANTLRTDAAHNTIVVNEAAFWRLKNAFKFQPRANDEKSFVLLSKS